MSTPCTDFTPQFQHGVSDRKAGKTKYNNPYPKGYENYNRWLQGWEFQNSIIQSEIAQKEANEKIRLSREKLKDIISTVQPENESLPIPPVAPEPPENDSLDDPESK